MRFTDKFTLPPKQVIFSWQSLFFLIVFFIYYTLLPWLHSGPEPSLWESVTLTEQEYQLCCTNDISVLKQYLSTTPDPKRTEAMLLAVLQTNMHKSDDFFKLLADYQTKPLYDERLFYLLCSGSRQWCLKMHSRFNYLLEKGLLNPVKLFVAKYFLQVMIVKYILLMTALVALYACSTKIRYPQKYQRLPAWLQLMGR